MERPIFKNYKGDGSAGDYANDMDDYCDLIVKQNVELKTKLNAIDAICGQRIKLGASIFNNEASEIYLKVCRILYP